MAGSNDRNAATPAAEASRARKPGLEGGQTDVVGTEARRFDGETTAASPVEGYLGAGTPANVDIHKLGQSDRPEEEWGEPGAPEATYSSNHNRRGERIDTLGQGGKTRRANKDIISRRG